MDKFDKTTKMDKHIYNRLYLNHKRCEIHSMIKYDIIKNMS